METFKDKNGQEWQIELTLGSIRRELESCDFLPAFLNDPPPENLLNESGELRIRFIPPDEKLFSHYIQDTNFCVYAVWRLCRKQAEERSISDFESFIDLLNGDAIENLRLAFWRELPNFFRQTKTSLPALVERLEQIQKTADEKLASRIKEILPDDELEMIVDKALKEAKESVGQIST